MKFCHLPHPRSFLFLLLLQCFVTKVSKIIPIALVFPPQSRFLGGLLTLYIPFQLILALHLLIMQVTSQVLVSSTAFLNLLWVATTKAALFKGHFFINVARILVVGIKCGGDSFSLNCSSTKLLWLTHCTCPFS